MEGWKILYWSTKCLLLLKKMSNNFLLINHLPKMQGYVKYHEKDGQKDSEILFSETLNLSRTVAGTGPWRVPFLCNSSANPAKTEDDVENCLSLE